MSGHTTHKIDETLKGWRTPFTEKESSWKAIQNKTADQAPETAKVIPMRAFLKVAAALILVLGLSWFMYPSADLIIAATETGQTKELTLPDGSVITLNAMSSVSYDAVEFLDSRELDLNGEAFFKVMKGSSFTVHSAQGDVTVLGTSFNVYSRESSFHVKCETGKVQVLRGDSKVILTPGLEVRSEGKELSEVIENTAETSWMNGRFLFVERPTTEVFDELERQFGITINTQVKEAGLFTGEFDRTDLESALEVVCNTMGLTYVLDTEGMTVLVRTNK